MRPWIVTVKTSLGKREVRVEKFFTLAATAAAAEARVGLQFAGAPTPLEVIEATLAELPLRFATYKEARPKEGR